MTHRIRESTLLTITLLQRLELRNIQMGERLRARGWGWGAYRASVSSVCLASQHLDVFTNLQALCVFNLKYVTEFC